MAASGLGTLKAGRNSWNHLIRALAGQVWVCQYFRIRALRRPLKGKVGYDIIMFAMKVRAEIA